MTIFGISAVGSTPPKQPARGVPLVLHLTMPVVAAPEPALRYVLTTPMSEQTPGEAAGLYLTAFGQLQKSSDETQVDAILDAPRETFKVADGRHLLNSHKRELALIEIASRRDRCHWDVPVREQGVSARLPYLGPARYAAKLLSLQVRIQIVEHHFDDALHTLQTGFGMVAHLNCGALPVQGLVAIGIAHLMLDRVQEFVQTPGAPNLYWALADLPRPIADMRAMSRMQQAIFEYELPELRRIGPTRVGEGAMAHLVGRIKRDVQGSDEPENEEQDKKAYSAIVTASEGVARKWLRLHGHSDEQVSHMSAAQAVGAYFIETYERMSDDIFKWSDLPYWQASGGTNAAGDRVIEAETGPTANPLLQLLPLTDKVHRQIALVERRIAMLQIGQAIRDYAATHDRKLPASLTDLELPSPADPMTGKSFEYAVSENSAILRSAAPPAYEGMRDAVFSITMMDR